LISPRLTHRNETVAVCVYLLVGVCAPPGVWRLFGPSGDSQQAMAAGAAVWAGAACPPRGDHWAARQAAQQLGASVESSPHAGFHLAQRPDHQEGWDAFVSLPPVGLSVALTLLRVVCDLGLHIVDIPHAAWCFQRVWIITNLEMVITSTEDCRTVHPFVSFLGCLQHTHQMTWHVSCTSFLQEKETYWFLWPCLLCKIAVPITLIWYMIWYDIPLFVPQWRNFKNHSSGAHQSINENKYKTQNTILKTKY